MHGSIIIIQFINISRVNKRNVHGKLKDAPAIGLACVDCRHIDIVLIVGLHNM